MNKIYFTVGPSQIYPSIPKHLTTAVKKDILSLSHRSLQFKSLFQETTQNLKKLLAIPDQYQIFFISSALEAMERTIQGCVQNSSFHIITGAFGKAWETQAKELGKNTLTYIIDHAQKAEIANINVPKEADIICITQNDTSTGYWIPPEEIVKLKKKHPEKLMAVDIVSSVPFVNFDFKYIDIAFFSVQKGFGLPAGLAVMIASPKALEKTNLLVREGIITGSYHSLKTLSEKAAQLQTPETPNVLDIYLLNCVLKEMLKTGITKIRQDTNKKALTIYSFFENRTKFEPFIKHPGNQSPTVTVFDVIGKSEKIRKKLAKFGFIAGAGYGDNKLNHIRIANFPAHKLTDIKQMLKYIA